MKMNVRVCEAIVIMLVYVNVRVLSQGPSQRTDAEKNNHDCYAKFQPTTHRFRNRNTQTQHDRRDNEERRRMSRAPERADERRMKDILVTAHNRRDRHNMIDFGRVFQAKHKTDRQDRHHAK